MEKLSGALNIEIVDSLEDIVGIASQLDSYDFYPEVWSDTSLGKYLVDTGAVEIHESALPYLDFDKVAAEFVCNNSGAYTDKGYVVKRDSSDIEQAPEEPQNCVFEMDLASDFYCENGIFPLTLNLPATDEALQKVMSDLRIKSWDECVVMGWRCPISNTLKCFLPQDGNMVAFNELAEEISCLSAEDGDIIKLCAALQAENPQSAGEALEIVLDLDDYELAPSSVSDPHEYGKYILYDSGRIDEFKEEVRDFIDYDDYGRYMMSEDGIRETDYGMVRRISEPFPEQTAGMQIGGM